MTVQELIDKLQKVKNKNAIVVVRGYERGVDEITTLKKVKIRKNVNNEWYYGNHEITKNSGEDAYYIFREE